MPRLYKRAARRRRYERSLDVLRFARAARAASADQGRVDARARRADRRGARGAGRPPGGRLRHHHPGPVPPSDRQAPARGALPRPGRIPRTSGARRWRWASSTSVRALVRGSPTTPGRTSRADRKVGRSACEIAAVVAVVDARPLLPRAFSLTKTGLRQRRKKRGGGGECSSCTTTRSVLSARKQRIVLAGKRWTTS